MKVYDKYKMILLVERNIKSLLIKYLGTVIAASVFSNFSNAQSDQSSSPLSINVVGRISVGNLMGRGLNSLKMEPGPSVIDSNGNFIYAGVTQSATEFEGSNTNKYIIDISYSDCSEKIEINNRAFIVKYSPEGEIIDYPLMASTCLSDRITSLAIDSQNNLYVGYSARINGNYPDTRVDLNNLATVVDYGIPKFQLKTGKLFYDQVPLAATPPLLEQHDKNTYTAILKFSSKGELLWVKALNDLLSLGVSHENKIVDLQTDSNSKKVIALISTKNKNQYNSILASFDTEDGTIDWSINTGIDGLVNEMKLNSEDQIIIGHTQGLVKYTSDGKMLWEKESYLKNESKLKKNTPLSVTDLAIDSHGSIYVTGSAPKLRPHIIWSKYAGHSKTTPYVAKFNTDGEKEWQIEGDRIHPSNKSTQDHLFNETNIATTYNSYSISIDTDQCVTVAGSKLDGEGYIVTLNSKNGNLTSSRNLISDSALGLWSVIFRTHNLNHHSSTTYPIISYHFYGMLNHINGGGVWLSAYSTEGLNMPNDNIRDRGNKSLYIMKMASGCSGKLK